MRIYIYTHACGLIPGLVSTLGLGGVCVCIGGSYDRVGVTVLGGCVHVYAGVRVAWRCMGVV